jgi:hypothetical protein
MPAYSVGSASQALILKTGFSSCKVVQDVKHLLADVWLDFHPVCSYVCRQTPIEFILQMTDALVWYVSLE